MSDYKTGEEFVFNLAKEPKQGKLERVVGRDSEFRWMGMGVDGMVPGICLTLDNGDEIELMFTSSKAISDLMEAITAGLTGTIQRVVKIQELIHDELGCKQTHQIMRESLDSISLVDNNDEGETIEKPKLDADILPFGKRSH